MNPHPLFTPSIEEWSGYFLSLEMANSFGNTSAVYTVDIPKTSVRMSDTNELQTVFHRNWHLGLHLGDAYRLMVVRNSPSIVTFEDPSKGLSPNLGLDTTENIFDADFATYDVLSFQEGKLHLRKRGGTASERGDEFWLKRVATDHSNILVLGNVVVPFSRPASPEVIDALRLADFKLFSYATILQFLSMGDSSDLYEKRKFLVAFHHLKTAEQMTSSLGKKPSDFWPEREGEPFAKVGTFYFTPAELLHLSRSPQRAEIENISHLFVPPAYAIQSEMESDRHSRSQ